MFLQCCKNAVRRGVFSKQKTGLGRGRSRDTQTPQNPDFGPAKKSSLPPCKNVQKMAFLGEKACIFGQFVHNFAQKWPLFCGHSPPLQGCQSVGKKPANLYSTKCRIFGPRTPPPVAPWWDTSSRRPPTGSRRPFSKNTKNRVFEKTMMEIGFLLWHYYELIFELTYNFIYIYYKFSILANRSVTPTHTD
jgi:hypothetical protein